MSTDRRFDQADIAALRAAVRGTVHRPTDDGYQPLGFNVAVSRRPWAVIDVLDADDVAAVVAFAAANGMTVAVHGTGHGATPIDGHTLLVRTSALDTVELDPAARTARVGAGVRWQTVIDAAAPHGLAPLCGSAPSVGVAGFLTGGGIGPLVRTVGASSDHVRAIDVVTGDGEIRTATPTENADLFWGLRGGKATLGIVTQVRIGLLELPRFYGGALYFDGADAAAVLHAWRSWTQDLPAEANTSIALLRLPALPGVPPQLAGRLTVAVRYVHTGPADEAAALFAPIRAAAEPILDGLGVLPYAAIGAVHADPVDPMPVLEDGHLLSGLPADAVDTLLAVAGPEASCPLLVVELRLLGGAFAAEPAVASAVCHRDAPFHLYAIGALVPPIAEAVAPAEQALAGAMGPWLTGGRLPNFAASGDPAVITACYDADTVEWLRALAQRYDPAGVLAVGQVVR
ncbi:FAD-binding oxidoreductase [Gordonia sp. PP30]|uniref:FAD-binding oxidoreductase n=1 Tax=Gordonia sp. PP30 TaxID=2935861 RepID=UPI001FFF65CB|nr:FAD-binding oxidoreductase [Gordonia sp. PP30]UQE73975.1 FAD-binding oxidoreductase [Gordonia sp. PP30]